MRNLPPQPPEPAPPKPAASPGPGAARAARLKAALKSNMARRKGQAKARQAPVKEREG